MRPTHLLAALLLALLPLACHNAGSTTVILPKIRSENIPDFFWLEYNGKNYVESTTTISHYVDVVLEEFGSADTLLAELFRVDQDYIGPCPYGLLLNPDSVMNRYCLPNTPGAYVLLFPDGNAGMLYIDSVIVK